MNTNKKSTWQRLVDAVEDSRQRLQTFREKRTSAIRSYVGAHYSEDGSKVKIPVNFLELALNIYRRQVAARNPQALITSRDRSLERIAQNFELAMGQLVVEIDFQGTMDAVVLDAMFGIGCVKCGVTQGVEDGMEGFLHDAGQPFADAIDFDDLVFDMQAKKWEQVGYAGNRYTLPYEVVMDRRIFTNRDIVPSNELVVNDGGDSMTRALSRGEDSTGDRTYKRILNLWDLWLPMDGIVATFLCGDDGLPAGEKPLRTMEWEGPEFGPFHMLKYGDVPGQMLPMAPVQVLIDLHDAINVVFRKLTRQAERQKTVTFVQAGADDDGKRVVNASDGETIRVDNAQGVNQASFGGVDQMNLAFGLQLKDLLIYMGGNLDTLGGLSPAAGTLGQEEILKSGASMRIMDMQERTTRFAKSVVKSLAYWLWTDPVTDYSVEKPIKNTDITIPVVLTSKEREEADFLDFLIDVSPYSMQSRTPYERMQMITAVWQNFLAPNAQAFQSQGVVLDPERLLEIMARYSDTPEIMDLIHRIDPAMLAQSSGGGSPEQSVGGPSERNYIRKDVGGSTRSGKDAVALQTLMGGGAQVADVKSAASALS